MSQTMSIRDLIELHPEQGVKLDPARHEVVPTMFAVWAQKTFQNPQLFTYWHRLEKTWNLAQWLDEGETAFIELWGTPQMKEEPLDHYLGQVDYERIREEILRALAVREQVGELASRHFEEKRKAQERYDEQVVDARLDKARHYRKLLEKQGRLSDFSEQYLERLEAGTVPWHPKDLEPPSDG